MRSKLFILTCLFLLFGTSPVFAVTVTISNVPQTITDQPFSFDVSITGASSATNYLKADFFQPNDTNYFGYTNNGTAWYNGSDYSQYLPVNITSSGYSGTVQAKIDSASSKFIGNGTYNLRIRRYTQSGNYTAGESNIISISVDFTSPTPSPTPTIPLTPISTPIPSLAPQASSSFTISNVPSQINSDQSFSVNINLLMPNSQNTDYYLKGAFKKSDGTRYLGLTKISNNWIEYSDDYSDQYKITTDSSGSWNGSVEVKPDTQDKDYKGSGDYIFKIGRFTTTGSGPFWSNEITLKINDINGPSSSSNPTPQSTLKTSPTPSSTNIHFPTLKPTPSIKSYYRIASVAGVQTSTPEGKIKVKDQQQTNPFIWLGLIFIFAGTGVVGYSVFKKNAKI